ncbi:unnamed protein product [Adineta ricciae]|uniref:Uncharacterized protein n=1 Tax=Adineta ricciae TaxID=249248 RepID=A0A816EX75_ADIRI|nr:unnamed protein product [Adineta ricciae]CAF1651729.1 unnamed protein product [Adineta ricciae]
MPHKTKRQIHSLSVINRRWTKERSGPSFDDDVHTVEISDVPTAHASDEDSLIMESSDEETDRSYFKQNLQIGDIVDLFQLCKSQANKKDISVLLYMVLRHFGILYDETDHFLKKIGGLSGQVAHKWATVFITETFDKYCDEGRGGKRSDAFYDVYPDIEAEAKIFAVGQCQQKAASFTICDLAQFINTKYCQINGLVDDASDLVRSVESCRLDLRKWGARFEPNTKRPYFEGHDRADVVAHRNQFVDYLLNHKDKYYTVTSGDDPRWTAPRARTRKILICHDESTFRTGEVRAKRWVMDKSAPFYSKGNGRSVMVSDFLVQHPSSPFFRLNQQEWNNAIRQYPELTDDDGLRYEMNSATVTAHLGVDPYFDNETILCQFERLFKLLKFKEEYCNHDIEVLVDNARTHTTKPFSINDFGKGIGTRCPVSSIMYIDENNNKKIVDCYFRSGPHGGQSKGLLAIASELGLNVSSDCKLETLKSILSNHRAFQNVSKLEQLAIDYGFKVLFIPKFHCELNPIEGFWCHQKAYVRKYSDQTFTTMTRLITQSRDDFVEKKISLKLFRRFWKAVQAYAQDQSYADVLKLFFSSLCTDTAVSHRRITNSNLYVV